MRAPRGTTGDAPGSSLARPAREPAPVDSQSDDHRSRPKFEPAAVRSLARLALEGREVRLSELQLAAAALACRAAASPTAPRRRCTGCSEPPPARRRLTLGGRLLGPRLERGVHRLKPASVFARVPFDEPDEEAAEELRLNEAAAPDFKRLNPEAVLAVEDAGQEEATQPAQFSIRLDGVNGGPERRRPRSWRLDPHLAPCASWISPHGSFIPRTFA
jgi:hypothetical protein